MTTSSTLRRKIGQCFMFGFQGQEPSEPLLNFFADWGLGGVIVFTRNASDGEAMRQLIEKVRAGSKEPILVSIDHEGGPVLRMSRGVSQLPSAMALVASCDPEKARRAGRIAGDELAAVGIDINLAPVFDVQSNKDNPGIGLRSFGETPEQVERFAIPYLEGLQSAGVSGTAKHFPGKGSASLDAHFDLPFIRRKLEDLRRIDYPPFEAAIRAGVDCFMGSHTVYEAYGDDVPGTLSERVMTGLLRDEMGFEGVLITDDLEMGAIRDHFGFERAIKSSFTAGADLLLICHDPVKQLAALELIERAVLSGEIPMERVERSVARVRELSAKHETRRRKGSRPLAEMVASHAPEVQALWRDSVCLVRGIRESSFPGRPGPAAWVVYPVLAELSPVEESSGDEPALLQTLQKSMPSMKALAFTPKQDGPVAEAVRLAREADVTFFFSYNAHVDPKQAALLEQVRNASKAFVLVALRNPYDLRFARPGDTALATLGFRPDVLRVASSLILGKGETTGKLPVQI